MFLGVPGDATDEMRVGLETRSRISRGSREGPGRCPRRRGSGCLRDGYCPRGSSTSLRGGCAQTDAGHSTEPPFDRHDWIIRRPRTREEVRYVIDYYSAPPAPDGEPVFALDVRPALDSVQSVKERVVVGTGELWEELSGRAWPR